MWKRIKKAAKKVVKAVKKAVRLAKELANRTAGIIDFVGSLIGIRPRKYLRATVRILGDPKGPVVPIADIDRLWVEAKRVFLDRANIQILALHGSPPIQNMLVPESRLLTVPECSFSEGFSDNSDYYEDQANDIRGGFDQTPLAGWVADSIGIGEGLVAFALRDIGGARGCSYPYSFYILLAASPPAGKQPPLSTTLAHELGHMCGLWDSDAANNLMNSERGDMDSNLSTLQISVIRNSRFVTYIKRSD